MDNYAELITPVARAGVVTVALGIIGFAGVLAGTSWVMHSVKDAFEGAWDTDDNLG